MIQRGVLKSILTDIIFFFAAYISLVIHRDIVLYYLFGLAFLISGVYGVICIVNNVRFIFAENRKLKI
ncbi:hypothetical protein KW787_00930 [Candidatus Pacearchaeota archaeon]|nr:hypothetical protein [Candidatus Pacearchaeota archaeon]